MDLSSVYLTYTPGLPPAASDKKSSRPKTAKGKSARPKTAKKLVSYLVFLLPLYIRQILSNIKTGGEYFERFFGLKFARKSRKKGILRRNAVVQTAFGILSHLTCVASTLIGLKQCKKAVRHFYIDIFCCLL